LKEVFINRLSKFLPNEPVSNDDIEAYIGMINGTPSRSRAIVLRNNGIKTRYYSIDKQGISTHTNAEMTAAAIKSLMDDQFALNDIQLLACGSTSPDQLLPSHASMVHGELGMKAVEIMSPSGSCCTGIQSMLYAWLNIAAGLKKNAVAAGSEKLSSLIVARHFQPESDHHIRLQQDPMIAFEKDFLRWMLSDGAGAALLQDQPNEQGLSLRVEWIESCSFAGNLPTCMWAGALKDDQMNMHGWGTLDPDTWVNESVFPLKQDVKLLGKNIVPIGGIMLKEVCERRGFDVKAINWFLPHLSSEFFREKIYLELENAGMSIPREKWFTNLSRVGNIGSASVYVMLEELFSTNRFTKGEQILCMIPESARFSYAYALLTVV
jgi:3-oxoacyl-[acyl-carrier-protein] synthase-3